MMSSAFEYNARPQRAAKQAAVKQFNSEQAPAAKRVALGQINTNTTQLAQGGKAKVFGKAAPAAAQNTRQTRASTRGMRATAVVNSSSSHAAPMSVDNTPAKQGEMMPIEVECAPAATAAAPVVQNWEDIDAYDIGDAQCCTDYVQDIFEYMRAKEVAEKVDPNYITQQNDINAKMISILADWMVDVHLKFKLLSETMFLSKNIIDRYLSAVQVPRHRLQLVGITAMLIGSKYEEIWAPEVRDFVYICDNAYSREQILELEVEMLNVLDFSLTPPTPLHLLRRFSKAARSDSKTHTLSKYLIELTLIDCAMLHFKPSTLAAAAVYIARVMRGVARTGEPLWNGTLEHYTAHTVKELMECAIALNALLRKQESTHLKATRRKYSSSKLLEVALIPTVDVLPF